MGSFLMLGLGLAGIAEVAASTKEEAVKVREEGVAKEAGALPLGYVAGDKGGEGGRGGSGGAEEDVGLRLYHPLKEGVGNSRRLKYGIKAQST